MKEKKLKKLRFRREIQRNMTHWRDIIGNPEFNPQDFRLERVEVTLTGLDPVFHGYTLVNISDIHLGQWITPQHLEGVVDMVNDQKPDAVAITGDFVSYLLDEVVDDLEAL